ncbi:MAG: histidine--tRNA ligase, partial [Chloroflexi bacterium]|nr:histidine--tRNA ligase [Chloroflexota bacterium]
MFRQVSTSRPVETGRDEREGRSAYPRLRGGRRAGGRMADLQAPRGMSDVLPEDEPLWRFVRDTAERVARSFDYRLINTPIVEDVRVFSRTVGDESDIVSKEMYVFEDRGGGELALRPEGTAAVCRAYIEHGMGSRPQPVRLYYFGPMFRYDRPQAGRYRQLWQFGVECIGDPSPAADAEIIELQYTLFRELGLDDLTLSINSIGTAETRRTYVDVLREHLRPHLEGLSHDSQRRFETNLLRILDSKEDADHPALRSAPSILDYLTDEDAEHFDEVRSLLDASGVPYEVAPRIVRGLDYYARTVWEFEPPAAGGSEGGQQGTVSAGGRYDGLMELLGGPPTPGTGTAMGVERTVLNLRA